MSVFWMVDSLVGLSVSWLVCWLVSEFIVKSCKCLNCTKWSFPALFFCILPIVLTSRRTQRDFYSSIRLSVHSSPRLDFLGPKSGLSNLKSGHSGYKLGLSSLKSDLSGLKSALRHQSALSGLKFALRGPEFGQQPSDPVFRGQNLVLSIKILAFKL